MAKTKTIIFSSILMLFITISAFIFVNNLHNLKYEITCKDSKFYIGNTTDNVTTWTLSGIESWNLYNKSKKLSYSKCVKLEYNDSDYVYVNLSYYYPNNVIIKNNYVISIKYTSIESFPLSHSIELYNATKLQLRYNVSVLAHHDRMKFVVAPNYGLINGLYVYNISSSKIVSSYYNYTSSNGSLVIGANYSYIDYSKLDFRLFDPVTTQYSNYKITSDNNISSLFVSVSIPASSSKTFYINRQTTGAGSQSNSSIFNFFDDFDGSSMNTSNWDMTYATSTGANSIMNITLNSGGGFYNQQMGPAYKLSTYSDACVWSIMREANNLTGLGLTSRSSSTFPSLYDNQYIYYTSANTYIWQRQGLAIQNTILDAGAGTSSALQTFSEMCNIGTNLSISRYKMSNSQNIAYSPSSVIDGSYSSGYWGLWLEQITPTTRLSIDKFGIYTKDRAIKVTMISNDSTQYIVNLTNAGGTTFNGIVRIDGLDSLSIDTFVYSETVVINSASFVSPTPNSGTIINTTTFTINITTSGSSLSNHTLTIYKNNLIYATNISYSSNYSYILPYSLEGNYSFNLSTIFSSGNNITSELRNVTINLLYNNSFTTGTVGNNSVINITSAFANITSTGFNLTNSTLYVLFNGAPFRTITNYSYNWSYTISLLDPGNYSMYVTNYYYTNNKTTETINFKANLSVTTLTIIGNLTLRGYNISKIVWKEFSNKTGNISYYSYTQNQTNLTPINQSTNYTYKLVVVNPPTNITLTNNISNNYTLKIYFNSIILNYTDTQTKTINLSNGTYYMNISIDLYDSIVRYYLNLTNNVTTYTQKINIPILTAT